MKTLALLTSIMMCLPAFAQETSQPLGFREWKNQQILDAQNQMLRASTKLTQARAGKAVPVKKSRLPNDKVRDIVEDDQTLAERELKRAQDGLANASALTFANYVDVYLPSLRDNPAAVQKLSEKLSREELSEIFRALMRTTTGADARRGSPATASLTTISRPRGA